MVTAVLLPGAAKLVMVGGLATATDTVCETTAGVVAELVTVRVKMVVSRSGPVSTELALTMPVMLLESWSLVMTAVPSLKVGTTNAWELVAMLGVVVMKFWMVGALTALTVDVCVQWVPAGLVTVRVKTVVAWSGPVFT